MRCESAVAEIRRLSSSVGCRVLDGTCIDWTQRRDPLPMRYLVIEHFRNGDARPVYRRFRDQGRLAPEGLAYVASWVTADMKRCYQVMQCEDAQLLEQW